MYACSEVITCSTCMRLGFTRPLVCDALCLSCMQSCSPVVCKCETFVGCPRIQCSYCESHKHLVNILDRTSLSVVCLKMCSCAEGYFLYTAGE